MWKWKESTSGDMWYCIIFFFFLTRVHVGAVVSLFQCKFLWGPLAITVYMKNFSLDLLLLFFVCFWCWVGCKLVLGLDFASF